MYVCWYVCMCMYVCLPLTLPLSVLLSLVDVIRPAELDFPRTRTLGMKRDRRDGHVHLGCFMACTGGNHVVLSGGSNWLRVFRRRREGEWIGEEKGQMTTLDTRPPAQPHPPTFHPSLLACFLPSIHTHQPHHHH